MALLSGHKQVAKMTLYFARNLMALFLLVNSEMTLYFLRELQRYTRLTEMKPKLKIDSYARLKRTFMTLTI